MKNESMNGFTMDDIAQASFDIHHLAASLLGESRRFETRTIIDRWYLYRSLYMSLAQLSNACREVGCDIGLPSWDSMVQPADILDEEQMRQECTRILRVLKEWGAKWSVDTSIGMVLAKV